MARGPLFVLPLVLAGWACQKAPPPDMLRIELPEVVTGKSAIRPDVRARRKGETASVGPEGYSVSATPAAVATAFADGTVSCVKTGDATVSVEVQGVSAKAELRCRLVDRLELSELSLLELGKGPVSLAVRVLAKDGALLNDVPVSVKAIDTTPLRVRGLELTPEAVGSTALIVRAGGAEERRDVRVVRRVDTKPTSIRGGKRADFDLPPGKYEVEVTLDRERQLSMDWRGSRQCAYQKTAKVHVSLCELREKGSVAVDNPAFLETGETALALERIVVREVP